MRTQEALNQRAVELAEQSRVTSALAAESLRAQWLTAPNGVHVIEKKRSS
ncbi:hypothetical protein [Mycobacteroides abscessus]|uniref:Uncharacterized protein n=1 Tax=Mycobacteroides abscessus subsp. abscessus TaxID=1185650 RepID=A0AB38CZS1_9MYCO|nr:hypothetical protein [Mycobacteroides abscessus]MBN7385466.1 hypothetical protein [Mycobacteroides abscessus subsp. abscessus]MBN7414371.1 hypothetical protein [Mycobacteroides abscessus subsp. abscessus]SHO86158.1 Uncharacterised protein [Mycobacteroides abscessus subsp. abscessus]SHP07950.1 Uncharacterised protein [Mycobacteroides abscessus subsp. abscessus]SHP38767.1 Uncharacterised protein [Mycobacteroides abscessus subsp. abscessus]